MQAPIPRAFAFDNLSECLTLLLSLLWHLRKPVAMLRGSCEMPELVSKLPSHLAEVATQPFRGARLARACA